MIKDVGIVLLLPLLGTAVGAAAVFVVKKNHPGLKRALNGFAAGVMAAASVWSLLLPALEQSGGMGRWSFVPAAVGLGLGCLFVMGMGKLFPDGASLTAAAVALHNFPEGMAVGVAAAGYLMGDVHFAACIALSAGIAIQNLPEGAIVSLPLSAGGMGKGKAFGFGVLSGVIEPVGALLTVCLAALAVPLLPWMLAFSAGAMLYVAASELIPDARSPVGMGLYMLGFILMMSLDVALG